MSQADPPPPPTAAKEPPTASLESDSSEEDEAINGSAVKKKAATKEGSANGEGGGAAPPPEEEEEEEDNAMAVDEVDDQGSSKKRRFGGAQVFPESKLASASDRFREAWEKIQEDEWDIQSWTTLLSEAYMMRCGKHITAQEVYRVALKQFPTAAHYWKELIEFEMKEGNFDGADATFKESLLLCQNVDLWMLYLSRVKAANPFACGSRIKREEAEQHRSKLVEAYDYVLLNVGISSGSAPVWWDYINFIKDEHEVLGFDLTVCHDWCGLIMAGWHEDGQADQGTKLMTLRKVYQRAVVLPLDGLDDFWQSYEQWERGMNESLATQFLQDLQQRHDIAKKVLKDRKAFDDGHKTVRLAVPPQNTREEKEHLNSLRQRIEFEKANPELVEPQAVKERVRLAFRQSFANLYHYPEVWHDFAMYEASTGDTEAAAGIYENAIQAVPDSLLLHLAYADLQEKRYRPKQGRASEGVQLLQDFLAREPCTLGYILYQRYVRRTKGKEAARKVFSATKCLRKEGKLSFQVYLAHAQLEYYVNKEATVAYRILDYGLSEHPEFVEEPDYVLGFTDLLIQMHDDCNVRGIFDRVLSSIGKTEKARPLWERLLEFESTLASEPDIARIREIQQRMAEAYPDDPQKNQDLMRLWSRCAFFKMSPATQSDELLRQRYDGTPSVSTPAASTGGGGRSRRDRRSAMSIYGPAAPRDRERRRRGDNREPVEMDIDQGDGDDAAAEQAGVPTFLRRLFNLLPKHSGPLPDFNVIIETLKAASLPSRPQGGRRHHDRDHRDRDRDHRDRGDFRDHRDRKDGHGGHSRKRWRHQQQHQGGYDSDGSGSDEDGRKRPALDIFRFRQNERLMQGYKT